jgi:hypothetical protein
MRKFLTAVVIVGFIALSLGVRSSFAGEIDILLQKLVEKGVLTPGEAQQIGTETKEQVKKEISQGKYSSLPEWVQNTKLKGDFRLRYQMDHSKTATNSDNDRHRGRIRMRLGVETKPNDKLLVGVGLATGTQDNVGFTNNKDISRSTNQSFDNTFSKHPIGLDYAYAKYSPKPWLDLIGGKLKIADAIWEPGDLVWDTDITPEGANINFNKNINSKLNLWMMNGVYILDETSTSNDDPYMIHIQPGFNYAFTDTVSLKAAVATDYFAVKAAALNNSANSNTGSSGGVANPTGNFLTVAPALELNIKEPFKALGVPFLNIPNLKFFGEYVQNTAKMNPNDNKTGYMAGFGFGAEKISNWGDWQLSYSYAKLGRDAVLDILPDSDRYGGTTNMMSHELIFQYGLGKNTYLSFDAYYGESLSQVKAPASVFQVDWNLKF